MSKTIHLTWTRYRNFFKLYEEKKDIPKLIYVVGLTKFVYVGNVGSNGGTNGLSRRYDKPYVKRAISIFGSDKPKSQPCFAGEFRQPSKVTKSEILNVEKIIQQEFLDNRPRLKPAFDRKGIINAMHIINCGQKPDFVDKEIEYA